MSVEGFAVGSDFAVLPPSAGTCGVPFWERGDVDGLSALAKLAICTHIVFFMLLLGPLICDSGAPFDL